MARSIFSGIALAILAGCTPLSLYYQEGTPVDRLSRDEAACINEGLRAVPADNKTRLIPGTKTPQTICDGAGNCHTVWVQISPDRFETYDANDGARRTYVRNCMIGKGYQRVSLPACAPEVVEATHTTQTRVLPPLTSDSCAIRLKGGGWQIVSP